MTPATQSDTNSGIAVQKSNSGDLMKIISQTEKPNHASAAAAKVQQEQNQQHRHHQQHHQQHHKQQQQLPPLRTQQQQLQRSQSAGPTARSEYVLHMDPNVAGWMVGMGGQRVRDIMDESGAKIWIDQESMSVQDPRVVYVSGQQKSVDVAVRMIKDLTAKVIPMVGDPQLSKQRHIHTLSNSPLQYAGAINAAAEKSVSQSYRHAHNPEIKLTAADLVNHPQSHHHQHKKSGLPLSGNGALQSQNLIQNSQVISDKLTSGLPQQQGRVNPSPPDLVHEMTCEARFVPLLIGRRGWTIKHIQDSSGARVDIDQSVTPRKIKISGKDDNVRNAIRMVRDVLSYPLAQLQSSTAGEIDASATMNQDHVAVLGDVTAPAPQPPPSQQAHVGNKHELPLTTARDNPYLSAAVHSPPPPTRARVDDTHSPPPSSLIMTGDAKSTISASSSLSSTPEPSMASSSKSHGGHIPGHLLARDFIGGGQYPQHLPAATNAFSQNCIPPSNLNDIGDSQGIGALPLFPGGIAPVIPPRAQCYPMSTIPPHGTFQQQNEFEQRHQQNIQTQLGAPTMLRDHHPQQPPDTGVHVAAGHPAMGQPPAQFPLRPDTQPLMHHSGSLDYGGSIPNHQNGMHLHQHSAFHPSHKIYLQQNTSAHDTGIINLQDNNNNSYANSGASLPLPIWGRNSSSAGAAEAPSMPVSCPLGPPSETSRLDSVVKTTNELHIDTATHNGVGNNKLMGVCSPVTAVDSVNAFGRVAGIGRGGSGNTAGTSNVLIHGRDDSRMVDSLFGPTSDDVGAVDHNVLSGFDALSLDRDGISSGNVWGSNVNTSSNWSKIVDSHNINGGIGTDLRSDQKASSALLAAIQPTLSHEPQHPITSRFIWGTTSNESAGQT